MNNKVLRYRMVTRESLLFEVHGNDTFSSVFKRYVDEQNLSMSKLAARTGIGIRTLQRYKSGYYIPNELSRLVIICIGLRINYDKAQYLMSLAHMSLGYDVQGMAYKMLIGLSFSTGITIDDSNDILSELGLPLLCSDCLEEDESL